MTRGRWWAVVGLAVALLAGVLVAVLQLNGTIEDPAKFACDLAVRRADCD